MITQEVKTGSAFYGTKQITFDIKYIQLISLYNGDPETFNDLYRDWR